MARATLCLAFYAEQMLTDNNQLLPNPSVAQSPLTSPPATRPRTLLLAQSTIYVSHPLPPLCPPSNESALLTIEGEDEVSPQESSATPTTASGRQVFEELLVMYLYINKRQQFVIWGDLEFFHCWPMTP
jgi:hypothetical protein